MQLSSDQPISPPRFAPDRDFDHKIDESSIDSIPGRSRNHDIDIAHGDVESMQREHRAAPDLIRNVGLTKESGDIGKAATLVDGKSHSYLGRIC